MKIEGLSLPPVGNPIPEASQDADAQAAFEIGMLVFLARGYAEATDPAQKAAILAEYNKILANFQVKGNQVTFGYNNGQEKVAITDPTIAKLIQDMEKSSSIDKIAGWYDATTDSPVETILNWLRANNFDMHNNKNPQTVLFFEMFMLATANNPLANLAGIGGDFLSEGLNNGAPLSNIQILAELLAQSGIDGKVIASCLSVTTQCTPFSELSKIFAANYQNWQSNPSLLQKWEDTWEYAAAFFPRADGDPSKTPEIHAPPASGKSHLLEQKNGALSDLSANLSGLPKKQKV